MYLYSPGTPFSSYARGRTIIDEIVLHESVTRTVQSTVTTLAARGCGVHIIVDPLGVPTQHVSLERACAHSEGFGKPSLHNERSIAIEVVNPYYGPLALPDQQVINAVWAHKGRYAVPPPDQLEGVWMVVQRLTYDPALPIPTHQSAELKWVPRVFPGVQRKYLVGPRHFYWGRIKKHEVPGVMAHHRWYHADALFVEHYCLLRSLGFASFDAHARTLVAASSGKRSTPLPSL